MFICGICNTATRPREKAVRIVTETREVTYPFRRDAQRIIKDGKKTVVDDPGGYGPQIAKEVLACPKCSVRYLVAKEVLDEIVHKIHP